MASNTLNLPTEETLQSIATSLQTMQGNVSGVKGNAEATFRTGQVNLTAANIGALPANTTYVESINGSHGVVTGLASQLELNEVRDIAEGAGAAVSYNDYAAMVSALNQAAVDDFKVGQSIYIITLNVPDLWISAIEETQILYYYTTDAAFTETLAQQGYVQIGYYKVSALETEKVNLTDYVTTNTLQTISATKTFSAGIDLGSGATITKDSSDRINLNYGNDGRIKIGSGNIVIKARLDPDSHNSYDLGRSGVAWRDLYLSRNLTDGTNSVAIEHLVTTDTAQTIAGAKTFTSTISAPAITDGTATISVASIASIDNTVNVVKVSEMSATNYFTQEQIAIIKNGKPTRIEGVIQTYNNIFITSVYQESSQLRCMFTYANNGQCGMSYFVITLSNGYANFRSNKVYFTTNEVYLTSDNGGNNSIYINGKKLANYPSSPTIPQNFNYLTNNTLAYEKVTKYNSLYEYASNSTTQLEYETINNISISADTTYTLATAPSGTYPEYKANITNTDTANAITITLPSGTTIKAESGITVSSNIFTIPADTTVIVSIQDDLAFVMIK